MILLVSKGQEMQHHFIRIFRLQCIIAWVVTISHSTDTIIFAFKKDVRTVSFLDRRQSVSGQSPLRLFECKTSLTELGYFSTHVKYKYEPICHISFPDLLQLSCPSAILCFSSRIITSHVPSITGDDYCCEKSCCIIIYFTIVFKTQGLQDLGSKNQGIH